MKKSHSRKNYRAMELSSLRARESGQLLLEVLIIVGIAAILVGLSAGAATVSLVSNKKVSERGVAADLVSEEFEAVRGAAAEKWGNLYNLTGKGDGTGATTAYYAQQSAGKWALVAGTESVTLDSLAYSRVFYVQNVCRDVSTRAITGVTGGSPPGSNTTCASGIHDPSTQNIIASVSWGSSTDSLSWSEYIERWNNKVCLQTAWSTVGDPVTPPTCTSPTVGATANYNTSTSVQFQAAGGASFCLTGDTC